MNTTRRIIFALEAAVDFFGRLAAWACVALTLLVSANVFIRYFFSYGTIWLQELEWHLLSPIATIGMSYALLKGDQVRVDILFDHMTPRQKTIIEIITGILLIAFSIILIKLSWPFVMQAYRVGEGSPNPGGLPYRFLLKAFIPFGFALLGIQGLCHTLKSIILLQDQNQTNGDAHVAQ